MFELLSFGTGADQTKPANISAAQNPFGQLLIQGVTMCHDQKIGAGIGLIDDCIGHIGGLYRDLCRQIGRKHVFALVDPE